MPGAKPHGTGSLAAMPPRAALLWDPAPGLGRDPHAAGHIQHGCPSPGRGTRGAGPSVIPVIPTPGHSLAPLSPTPVHVRAAPVQGFGVGSLQLMA